MPPRAPSHRHGPVAALGALAVAYLVASARGWEGSTALFSLTTCGAAALAAVSIRHLPPGRRLPWIVIVAGMGLTALGDLAWGIWFELAGDVPSFSVVDIAYLGGGATLLAGYSALARFRFGPFDVEAALDSFLVSGTLLVIGWEPVLEPTIRQRSGGWLDALVLATYPMLDLALVAAIAVVVANRSTRTGAARWLLVSAPCLLVADAMRVVSEQRAWTGTWSQTLIDALWLAAALCVPIAVRSADAATATTQATETTRGLTVGRLVIAAGSLLAPTGVVLVASVMGEPPDLPLVIPTAILSAAATLWRLHRLLVSDEVVAERLAHQQLYFRDLVEHASDAVIVFGVDGSILDATPSVFHVYGWTDEQLRTMSSLDLVRDEDVLHCQQVFVRVLAEPDAVVVDELQAPRADGSLVWLSARYTNRVGSATVRGVVANISDITDRKHAELELTRQALHDGLTGLANRTLLVDRLAHALRRRRPGGVALLYLDLDRFKIVNDSLGHAAGDQLLVTTAARLSTAVRSGDTVARLGGDEFAVLVEDDGEPVTAALLEELSERLLAAVRQPVAVGSTEVVVGTSIGIACAEAHTTAHDLLRDADVALYAAKAQGRDRAALFDLGMQSAARDRQQLETDLRLAIERGELHLQYQPILDMDSMRLSGFEALVRWRHPERGLIGPDTFIPIAEETGLVVPLGTWVLGEACRTAMTWIADRPDDRPLSISINVSAVQIADPGFAAVVEDVLRTTGIPAELVILELTETALVKDPTAATARLHELKALGVRLAIDDFGTGYSSLGYLRQFPIDVLKIDRSFLDPGTAEAGLPPIVRGVLDLGATMGLMTIAEGVETDAQMARLMDSGCRYGQGFLFARPLDRADACALAVRVGPLLDPAASATHAD
jgi:diguanylate cyclase (GGDEF)-like protein/PAS domain S-box-containing protein